MVFATLLAAALSFLDRAHKLTPARLVAALVAGVRGVLAVAAVCPAAGWWQTLRYPLPAYLAPIAFVVTPNGLGLLCGAGRGRQR
ncbi:hypothetical protein ACH4T9_19345 [Micromonospora sp. NPDC020750]|uniref:hypothetical protein n=1 Tax=unclassified Micromonospora TaxID=2617518 RepID=UPI003798CC2A